MKAKVKKRLLKLAEHLDKMQEEQFDMRSYVRMLTLEGHYERVSTVLVDSIGELEYTEKSECGTICCAVGEAVLIRKELGLRLSYVYDFGDSYRLIDWGSIGLRLAGGSSRMRQWLFSEMWYYVDNTPRGTAKRIRWTCKNNGVPNNWDEQLHGVDPLCYV